MPGKILKGVGGLYEVDLPGKGIYACRARGIFRQKKIRPNVGDEVEIDILSEEEREGSITRIYPRKNSLIRPMVANVDQAVLVFAIHEPEPNYHLLNTFLLMMRRQEIPVLICLNKIDLAGEEETARFTDDYRGSGCEILLCSAEKEQGIEDLRRALMKKTTVLAGPSGVGKSSLLNRIMGQERMETGSVSRKIKRGRHTTRHSELMKVESGTYILDTPGFSSLEIPALEKEEVRDYFPEFFPYEGRCRFQDCAHIKEPDCAVREAVAGEKISRLRYDDYVMIYQEISERRKW